jgi:hypothetical protein
LERQGVPLVEALRPVVLDAAGSPFDRAGAKLAAEIARVLAGAQAGGELHRWAEFYRAGT